MNVPPSRNTTDESWRWMILERDVARSAGMLCAHFSPVEVDELIARLLEFRAQARAGSGTDEGAAR